MARISNDKNWSPETNDSEEFAQTHYKVQQLMPIFQRLFFSLMLCIPFSLGMLINKLVAFGVFQHETPIQTQQKITLRILMWKTSSLSKTVQSATHSHVLRQKFRCLIISHRDDINWSPRSCNLPPLHFCRVFLIVASISTNVQRWST